MARAQLYKALIETRPLPASDTHRPIPDCAYALAKLRESNNVDELPKVFLTAALYAGGLARRSDEAKRHLAEAQQIAERGPMPLYLADVHLHRARLFRDKDELAKAAKLIRELGYGRRYDELADAEEAAKHW